MTGLWVAAMLAFASVAAHAQGGPSNLSPIGGSAKTPEQIAKEKKAEQAYRDSLRNIPDKEDKDPWSGVRSGDAAAAPAAKPAKPARTAAKRSAPPKGAAAPATAQQ